MELKGYLQILSRRKWIIVIATIVTLAVVVAGTLSMMPIYQATTTLRVATAHQGSLDSVSYNTTYADRLMNTYAKVITSSPMLDELRKRLGLAKPPAVKVGISANTELMQISVEDPNPVIAAKAANTLADLLLAYVKATENASDITAQQTLDDQMTQALNELMQARNQYNNLVATQPNDLDAIATAGSLLKVKEDTYSTLVGLSGRAMATQSLSGTIVSVVEPSAVPESPAQPKKALNIALGFLVGLVGGVGLAFLLENLDATLYTTEQIEKATELNILGKIPSAKLIQGPILNGTSPAGEAFRHVRTSLLNLDHGSSLRTLLITSAEPGEGKSTLAINLAYTLAQTGRKSLLIDCDMRAPTLHKILGLSNDMGLSTVLCCNAVLPEAVQFAFDTGLWVLPSGPLPSNPAELLGSVEMTHLLKQATEKFDIVILDTPSILAVADGAVIAPKADAAVLVVAQARAKENAVKAACRTLGSTNVKMAGVIVNHTETDHDYRYYAKYRQGK